MSKINPPLSRPTRNQPARARAAGVTPSQPRTNSRTEDKYASTPAEHESISDKTDTSSSLEKAAKNLRAVKQQEQTINKTSLPNMVHFEVDLADLQASHCRFGRPLILLSKERQEGGLRQFFLSDEFLENRDLNVNAFRALEHKEAFLFNATSSKQLRPLEVQWILHEDAGSLYEVVFDLNLQSEGPDQFTRQFGMAALLASGLLGFVDEELANTLRSQVPKNSLASGLNSALLLCHGEKGASAAKFLLDWGASPNACTPDDDMSALVCALSREDQPMIKLLVERGADTTSDLGAHESAAQLVTEEGFTHLAPLLHPPTSSSSPI